MFLNAPEWVRVSPSPESTLKDGASGGLRLFVCVCIDRLYCCVCSEAWGGGWWWRPFASITYQVAALLWLAGGFQHIATVLNVFQCGHFFKLIFIYAFIFYWISACLCRESLRHLSFCICSSAYIRKDLELTWKKIFFFFFFVLHAGNGPVFPKQKPRKQFVQLSKAIFSEPDLLTQLLVFHFTHW